MVTQGPPKVGQSSAVRRWLLGPVVVFLLSTGLVMGTGQAARADLMSATPAVVGTVLRGVPKSGLTRAFCVGGPLVCAAVTAGTLGFMAYQERDTWMPIVNNIFDGEWGDTEPGTSSGTNSCGSTMSVASLVREPGFTSAGAVSTSQNGLAVAWSYGGNSCSSPSLGLELTQVSCLTAVGTVVPGRYRALANLATGSSAATYSGVWDLTNNSSTSGYQSPCGAGDTLLSAAVRVSISGKASNVMYRSWGADIPEASNVQQAVVKCEAADGVTYTTITDEITGHPDRVYIPSCAERNGGRPVEVTIKRKIEGSTFVRDITKVTEQVSVKSNYGDCFVGGQLVCSIRVYVNGDPCQKGDAACVDWQTYAASHPSRVECRFGAYVVAIGNCDQLKYAYKTATKTVTQVDTATGEPILDPDASASPGTSTGGFPGTGTNPGSPAVTPGTDADPDTQSCFAAAWSWNPVDWVYVPVKCSLIWAFVPKNPPSFSDVPNPLPAGWLPDFPDVSGSDCGSVTMPRLDFNGLAGLDGVGPVTLFDTCADPWPLARTFVYNGLLAGVLVTVMWRGYRAVATSLGMAVDSPSGGDDE